MSSTPPFTPASTAKDSASGYGYGLCQGHHGELLQGVFESDSELQRGLVTLPCGLFWAEARARLRHGSNRVIILPHWKKKAKRAAELAIEKLGLHDTGAELDIVSNIPTSHGFGSSTADVVATTRAVVNAARMSLPEAELAHICVAAETACDPLMIDRIVLFAQRQGIILKELAKFLPPLDVVGFTTNDRPAGVDTLSLPPARYTPYEIEQFRRILGLMEAALSDHDAKAIGAASTESAYINQTYLPIRKLEEIHRLADTTGAVGIQVAHSGNVGGLLFYGLNGTKNERILEAKARLQGIGITSSWHYAIYPGMPKTEDRVTQQSRPL